ncbi:MAG TPA: hypothetical protein VGQ95_08920 [Chthoniobacterales bacterium]|nr:hypothetical protein [Chthoniobacterales bacterium]
MAIGSLVIAIAPFVPRYRSASLWLRLGLFLTAPFGIAWSVLGFYLLLHEIGGKTSLPWPRFWALDHMKSNIAGLAVGMLVCLILSPEARSLGRRKRSV